MRPTLTPKAAFLTTAMVFMAGVPTLQAGKPNAAADQDRRIEASAKGSYNFKTYLKDDDIRVASNGGVVTLTGSVSKEFHRLLAQETVAGLPGVKSVNNQLLVVGDQPPEHSDGWITMKVKTVLAFHSNVSASGTEVHTENGIVTLTGKADSEAQSQLTCEYAKDVEGVTEVRNQLVVTKPAKPAERSVGERVDDASITAQIKSTLLFHRSTHALATRVATKNGVVTLHGEARNASERDLVSRLAKDIKGVERVNNLMTLQKS